MDDIKKINNINKIKQNTINKLTTIIKKIYFDVLQSNKTKQNSNTKNKQKINPLVVYRKKNIYKLKTIKYNLCFTKQ